MSSLQPLSHSAASAQARDKPVQAEEISPICSLTVRENMEMSGDKELRNKTAHP